MTRHDHGTFHGRAHRLLGAGAAVALCALLTACGGADGNGDAEDAAETGSSTTADLLSSQDNLSRGASRPGAVEAPPGSLPPGRPLAEPQASIRPESEPPPPPPEGATDEEVDLEVLGHTVGEADAPVRIVEFSDFGCGYCRKFHMETYPSLEEEYVETGKVLWKYVPMILGMFGRSAEIAAHAGECALEQDRFPAMRDRLFEDQPEWKGSSDPMAFFRRYAEEEGLDVERWERCVNEGWRANRVDFGTHLSRQVGVRGTPTFFVVGYAPIPGALPLEIFKEVLDSAYAQAQRGTQQNAGGR